MDAAAATECRTGLATRGSLASEGAFAQGPSRCNYSMGHLKVSRAVNALPGAWVVQMLRPQDLQATAAVVKPVRPKRSYSAQAENCSERQQGHTETYLFAHRMCLHLGSADA